MSARRRLLVGATLALERATAEELEVLTGIGPKLAARILDERARMRAEGLVLGSADLAQIRGVGARRAAQLTSALGLDEEVAHDICSSGSWPTTSSGCDKQP